MGVNINVEKAISDYKKAGQKTAFESSLKKIFEFASTDPKINSSNHLAYLLATAKIEADYSLERWESDYVCGDAGVKYKDKPCQSAINYYCSTKGGKQDYCAGQPKDKRGLPYFGRGIIQLTWKENYDTYGKKIGVNLVDNPDLIFVPKNSYNVSVAYLTDKRGKSKKSTFDWLDEGNLTRARKTINAKGVEEANKEYEIWKKILQNNLEKPKKIVSKKRSKTKLVLGIGLAVVTLAVTGTLIYLYLKKNNKLPNFIKNFKIKK
jgi:hypothetical protein